MEFFIELKIGEKLGAARAPLRGGMLPRRGLPIRGAEDCCIDPSSGGEIKRWRCTPPALPVIPAASIMVPCSSLVMRIILHLISRFMFFVAVCLLGVVGRIKGTQFHTLVYTEISELEVSSPFFFFFLFFPLKT